MSSYNLKPVVTDQPTATGSLTCSPDCNCVCHYGINPRTTSGSERFTELPHEIQDKKLNSQKKQCPSCKTEPISSKATTAIEEMTSESTSRATSCCFCCWSGVDKTDTTGNRGYAGHSSYAMDYGYVENSGHAEDYGQGGHSNHAVHSSHHGDYGHAGHSSDAGHSSHHGDYGHAGHSCNAGHSSYDGGDSGHCSYD